MARRPEIREEDRLAPNYFDRLRASPYDYPLQKQIARGVVPAGCLQGGAMVAGMTMAGLDPCVGCAGPRARCGGRPAVDTAKNTGQNAGEVVLPDAMSGSFEDAPAGARAQARRLQAEELRVIIRDRLAQRLRDSEPEPQQ